GSRWRLFTFTVRSECSNAARKILHPENQMTPPLAFETASRLWRDRIVEAPDYSVIRNDRLFVAGMSGAPVLESEYRDIQRFKSILLAQHRETPLEELFPGRTIETPEGPVYCITRRHAVRIPEGARESVRKQLEGD